MADFYTHVSTSSVLGVGYAGMGLTMLGMPIETSIVAGGLCGLSGMLPDLDSDSGIPVREAMGFAAGVIPMLLVDRFSALNISYDCMVLLTAGLYFLIRFAGASLLGRFSVHRGMFHSIPAALIFAGMAFLLCGSPDVEVRYFKAGAVLFGVLSHLLLDEIYSIQWKGGSWRFKRSFGSALKLWGNNGWANVSTYTKLAIVISLITSEPSVMEYLEQRNPGVATRLRQVHGYQENLMADVRVRVGDTPHPSPLGRASPPHEPLAEDTGPPLDSYQPNSNGYPPGAPAMVPSEYDFRPNSGGAPFEATGRAVPPHQAPLPRR